MCTVPSVWKEQRLIESFETDMKGRLKPHMLFAYLLNSAWKHAGNSPLGYHNLTEHNLMWVMTKLQLSIARAPKCGEQISIETWGKGVERFYALRDYAIHSAEGVRIASATSAWMILDKDSYRPQRMDRMKEDFPWEPGRSEMDTDLGKIPEAARSVRQARYRVLFTDIDVNRHVSAVKYLQWIVDSHPPRFLEKMYLKSIEINYLAEAVLEDEVAVCFEPSDDRELCSIRRTGDEKELCRAKMVWQGEESV